MQRLILVRHGETDWNRLGRYQGFAQTSLNARGRQQAERVADWLAGWDIDVIYASDLPRTLETARPIADRLGQSVRVLDKLREIDVGEWEGLTVSEIRVQHADNWQAWLADPINTRRKGGESLAQLADRVAETFRFWEREHVGDSVLAVTHGGPIKALVCMAIGLPQTVRMHLEIDNTSVTVLVRRRERWVLQTLNSTCHL